MQPRDFATVAVLLATRSLFMSKFVPDAPDIMLHELLVSFSTVKWRDLTLLSERVLPVCLSRRLNEGQ